MVNLDTTIKYPVAVEAYDFFQMALLDLLVTLTKVS